MAATGASSPSSDTIADGSYPLSRSLYIYVNTDDAASDAAVKAFVDYYLSDEGIQSVVDADYVAIPPDQLDATRPGLGHRNLGSQRVASPIEELRGDAIVAAEGGDRSARLFFAAASSPS